MSVSRARKLLNESGKSIDLGSEVRKAWNNSVKFNQVNNIEVKQNKISDTPPDVMEILLVSDPASANSFIYSIDGIKLDRFCKILNTVKGMTVAMRSGSIVVLDKNTVYSYNREALTSMYLSQPVKEKDKE